MSMPYSTFQAIIPDIHIHIKMYFFKNYIFVVFFVQLCSYIILNVSNNVQTLRNYFFYSD